jgi:hypothetical protein
MVGTFQEWLDAHPPPSLVELIARRGFTFEATPMIRVRINARTKAASGKFTTIAKDPPTSISVVTSTVTSKRSRGLINGSATKVISALRGVPPPAPETTGGQKVR